MAQSNIRIGVVAGLICVVFLVAACGNRNRGEGGESTSGGAAAGAAVPTMPAARFAMPTSMIGANESSTTTVAAGEAVTETAGVTETTAAGTPEPAAASVDLSRGQTVYTNRSCAECHGEQGEGVADKGAAVAGTALTFVEFEDVMRTGKGIGPDHIYGPTAISRGGLEALLAWLQSLPAQ